MKPTVLTLTGGARGYVELPPGEVRRTVRQAARRGRDNVLLRGHSIALKRIVAVAGEPIAASGEDAERQAA